MHLLVRPAVPGCLPPVYIVDGGSVVCSQSVLCHLPVTLLPLVLVLFVAYLCLFACLSSSWAEDYNRKNLKHGTFEPHEAAEVQVRQGTAV
jgi:hypothetical protein